TIFSRDWSSDVCSSDLYMMCFMAVLLKSKIQSKNSSLLYILNQLKFKYGILINGIIFIVDLAECITLCAKSALDISSCRVYQNTAIDTAIDCGYSNILFHWS